ncbi:MAG: hypothetical protein R3F61_12895 [Myxococcota bacterium]
MHRGVRRTAAAVAAAELVPVPLLDTWLQNRARRWLVRSVAAERALELTDDEVSALADAPIEPLRRVALWPVKAVLKKVFFVYGAVAMVREAHEVAKLPDRVGPLPPEGA